MSNKFQIQLPKPCHENWDNMSPVEQGRFCNSCQKAVVDFTVMSDAQLVAFFKKPSTGSVCGRFDNDQVGRDLSIPGKRMPWLKYFLNLLIPAFLLSNKARSQGEPRIIGDTVYVEKKKAVKDENGNIKEEKNDIKKIKGKVTDENGMPIYQASVVIKGNGKGVITDINGNYEIDVSGYDTKQVLSFSYVGFEAVEKSIGYLQKKPECVLQLSPMMMGEVVVTGRCFVEKKKGKKKTDQQ